jgi:hypothetical protein
MENRRFNKFLIFGQLSFTVALLFFVFFQWNAKQELSISLSAEICAVGDVDFGVWTGQLSVSRPDLKDAHDELERNRERIFRNFTAKGILPEAIEFLTIQTKSDSNQFELKQQIVVKTNDLERLKKVSSESGELLKFRIDFSADEPQYHISNFAPWLLEQLPKLINSANAQAKLLLSAGQEIRSIKSFKMKPVSSMSYEMCENQRSQSENLVLHIFLSAEIEFLAR